MNDVFVCDLCSETFAKEISDEEAMEEANRYWPELRRDDAVIVCDDCWLRVDPGKPENRRHYERSLALERLLGGGK